MQQPTEGLKVTSKFMLSGACNLIVDCSQGIIEFFKIIPIIIFTILAEHLMLASGRRLFILLYCPKASHHAMAG